jgi:dienelactone hydrolase
VPPVPPARGGRLNNPEYPPYAVGFRTLDLHRGAGRPLPTLVFYPARSELTTGRRPQPADGFFALTGNGGDAQRRAGGVRPDRGRPGRADAARSEPGGAAAVSGAEGSLSTPMAPVTRVGPAAYPELVARLRTVARAGVSPARGRFPLVFFSHGMSGSAERYAPVLAQFASAGFVVVAPTYPYTSEFAPDVRRADIVHQPDDARFVLAHVLRLNYTAGDPLRHRIDTAHIAAVGHSAGGYTTTGLFVAGHDPRLRAGVVMAGWRAPGAFAGPPAQMLFLQGTSDPVVPRAISHAAWLRVPWAKAYMLLRGNSHSTYLQPGDVGYTLVRSTVIDFLRWTLLGDVAARARLPRMVKATARTQGTHR